MQNLSCSKAGRPGLLSLLIAVLAFAPLASAKAEPTRSLELSMVMYVAGLTAGKMKLSIDLNDDDAATSLRLKSKGMVKLITGYKGRSEARATLPEKAWPVPVSYDSSYETKKHDRRIEIRYSPDDGAITNLQTWKRGEPRTTNVPEDLWSATIDPLTAILHIRHWILALRQDQATSGQQAFEVFDGRRRYRLNAGVIKQDHIKFGDRDLPVFRLKVVVEPLAGFSKRDMLANWSSEDGERWIELVITDDDNPIPLSLETRGGTLKTTIFLEEACDGKDGCTNFGS